MDLQSFQSAFRGELLQPEIPATMMPARSGTPALTNAPSSSPAARASRMSSQPSISDAQTIC